MDLDPTSIAALVAAWSSLIGAVVFALRSRVTWQAAREERRLAVDIANDEARTRAEAEMRASRDEWRIRAERAERHERELSEECADLRAIIEGTDA